LGFAATVLRGLATVARDFTGCDVESVAASMPVQVAWIGAAFLTYRLRAPNSSHGWGWFGEVAAYVTAIPAQTTPVQVDSAT